MTSGKLPLRRNYSRGSEAQAHDFSHQGFQEKWMRTGELAKFSTSAQGLLLLLVLLVLYLI